MKRIVAVAVSVALLAAGIAAAPVAAPRVATTSQISVYCPNGGQPPYVSPAPATVAVGDSVVWRMAGAIKSDTLVITLKDAKQSWPFDGPTPRGSTSARTGAALVKGTFGYNVHLDCRMSSHGSESVDIDPDVIIQ
jgi:hypothetical protein